MHCFPFPTQTPLWTNNKLLGNKNICNVTQVHVEMLLILLKINGINIEIQLIFN